jgi:hypothetical protein
VSFEHERARAVLRQERAKSRELLVPTDDLLRHGEHPLIVGCAASGF